MKKAAGFEGHEVCARFGIESLTVIIGKAQGHGSTG